MVDVKATLVGERARKAGLVVRVATRGFRDPVDCETCLSYQRNACPEGGLQSQADRPGSRTMRTPTQEVQHYNHDLLHSVSNSGSCESVVNLTTHFLHALQTLLGKTLSRREWTTCKVAGGRRSRAASLF